MSVDIPDLLAGGRCRVRHCVNPAHLEPVTNRENGRRGFKGQLLTHCRRGHPYDEANTRVRPSDGRRECRACRREQWSRRAAGQNLQRRLARAKAKIA